MRNKCSLAVQAHLCFSNENVDNGGIQKEDAEWPVDLTCSARYEISCMMKYYSQKKKR